MSESSGVATAVVDGFQVSSNQETPDEIKANLTSEPAPKDGPPPDPEEEEKTERSKAAAKLGKAGGEAAAKMRAKAGDTPGEEAVEDEKAPAPEEKDEEEPEKKPNPRHDAKARIQQLARERAEERAKRQELEARLARLEAERATPPPPPSDTPKRVAAAPQGDDEPSPDGFDTYEDYVKAVARHAARKERETVLREQAEAARQQAHAESVVKRVETFNERIKSQPDVLERVDPRLLELQPTFTLQPGTDAGPLNVLADALVESEIAPQIMLYLTEHEDEVIGLLKSQNPGELWRKFGRLESRLMATETPSEAPKAPKQTFSQAKPPVRPVTPSAQVAEDDLGDDLDFDSYMRKHARKAR